MPQLLCVTLLLAAAFLFNAPLAAAMAADGNWGGAVGRLFFGPVAFFYLLHTASYYAVRALRGRERVASYSRSRINYAAMGVAMLGILGQAGQRMAG